MAINTQAESKKIVLSFLYYYRGVACSGGLGDQREALNQTFDASLGLLDFSGNQNSEFFASCLSQVVEFRKSAWVKPSKKKLTKFLPDDLDLLAEEIEFIRSSIYILSKTNTELAVPFLVRFWAQESIQNNNIEPYCPKYLYEATKILMSFFILRRSITQNTDGIDADFKKLFEKSFNENQSLCRINNINLKSNELSRFDKPSLKSLRKEFRDKLISVISKGEGSEVVNKSLKERYMRKGTTIKHYNTGAFLSKVMLLITHNCSISDDKGCLSWSQNTVDANLRFPDLSMITHDTFKEIEHIYPQNPEDKYKLADNFIHNIGNLTLLPKDINEKVSNSLWSTKRLYYRLMSEDLTDKEIQEVQKKLKIKSSSEISIKNHRELTILKPLICNEKWAIEEIRARSTDLFGILWDELYRNLEDY